MVSGSISGLMGFTVGSPITAKRKFSRPQVGIARLCSDSLIKTSERRSENDMQSERERERVRNPARLHVVSPFFVHVQKAEKPSFLPW